MNKGVDKNSSGRIRPPHFRASALGL